MRTSTAVSVCVRIPALDWDASDAAMTVLFLQSRASVSEGESPSMLSGWGWDMCLTPSDSALNCKEGTLRTNEPTEVLELL